MFPFERHDLVGLSDEGWEEVLALHAIETANARACLDHWAAHRLPLVVTRQLDCKGGGPAQDSIAVGLPAPARWMRERIALRLPLRVVHRAGAFPELRTVAAQCTGPLRENGLALCDALDGLHAVVRVHGSHGWQQITGMDYVHPRSDMDLLVRVNDAGTADRAASLLAEAGLGGVRLDGELVFTNGAAVAWREWLQWRAGTAAQILVKRRDGAALEGGSGGCPWGLNAPAFMPAKDRCPAAFGAGDATRALQHIGRSATAALYDELALAPKPGLVSFIDSGSHRDMDAATFMRSLFALRHYFVAIAALGHAHADFAALQACGIAAEARMLAATGGVNTHRGAIFTLGLLCASAGALLRDGVPADPAALRSALQRHWGKALLERSNAATGLPGGVAAQRHGLRSASHEAALGFPTLFGIVAPALSAGLLQGLTETQARLDALFHAMAALDDTNLVHRGGMAGLRHAQDAARRFLAAGGAARPGGLDDAFTLHRDFIARRLSPGGSADMLAAACWVLRLCPSRGMPPDLRARA